MAKRLPVVSYPRWFGTQAIRTQTQWIPTQAADCFVPIRFHQPKQRLTVSLAFSGGTLNSAEKKSRRKKENHALPEHACQANHTIAWDNSKIITNNCRCHQP